MMNIDNIRRTLADTMPSMTSDTAFLLEEIVDRDKEIDRLKAELDSVKRDAARALVK